MGEIIMKHSYSDMVENVQFMEYITGPYSRSMTPRWSIMSTDLGIPFYSSKNNCMYMIFGDTFGTQWPSKEKERDKWRGNVLGIIENTDLSNGLIFNDFIKDNKGDARYLFDFHGYTSDKNIEVTKIGQGGIEVNGALYMFVESIRSWGQSGFWNVNYTGVIKSTDNAETWERVYDLSWVETDEGEFKDVIQELVQENNDMQPSGVEVNLSERVAPFFGQIYPVDGKDGYIYIYGRRAGRQFGIKCGRVKKADFENFQAYEYLIGFDANNDPIWVKGTAGLKAIAENDEASYIVSTPASNMTVFYNNYLNKWVLLYFKPGVGIVMRTSETPYGKFLEEDEQIVLSKDYPLPAGEGGLYGAFSHELFQSNNGKTFYFIVSQWNKVTYNSMLYKCELK